MSTDGLALLGFVALLALSTSVNAATVEVVLLSHPSALAHAHAPGADGLLGTADDFVSPAPLAPGSLSDLSRIVARWWESEDRCARIRGE